MEEENKITEETTQEVVEEPKAKGRKTKKKKGAIRIVWDIISTLIVLAIIFFAVMGILGVQRVNEDKEPYWYINVDKKTVDNKEITTYNLALFEIVQEKTSTEKKTSLKPFFYKYFEGKEEAKDTTTTTTTEKKKEE